MVNEHQIIGACLKKIEEQFDRGSSDKWTTRDFEELSLEIYKKTNTQLSISTLKRLWGRINHKNQPNQTTLNTLAQFLGKKNWRHFIKTNSKIQSNAKKDSGRRFALSGKKMLPLIVILILTTVLLFYQKLRKPKTDSSKIVFKNKVVTTDVPNSVIFKYQLGNVDENSTIEIQQSWDERKRQRIKKEDSIATSVYYRPGLFEAKLVVNDSIMKETEVFIKTNGWKGLVEENPMPVYLLKEDFMNNGILSIDEHDFIKYGVKQNKDLWTGFYLVKEFQNLSTDDFVFSAEFSNTSIPLFDTCKRVRIAILHNGGGTVIPLSKKGCISEIYLKIFDKLISGKTNDLSNFGVDFSQIVNLKCISHQGFFKILINDKEILRQKTSDIKKDIVGIAVNFEGTGAIKKLILENSNGMVYNLSSEFH